MNSNASSIASWDPITQRRLSGTRVVIFFSCVNANVPRATFEWWLTPLMASDPLQFYNESTLSAHMICLWPKRHYQHWPPRNDLHFLLTGQAARIYPLSLSWLCSLILSRSRQNRHAYLHTDWHTNTWTMDTSIPGLSRGLTFTAQSTPIANKNA